MGRIVRQRPIDDGESVPVGGHHADLSRLAQDFEEDAVQVVAGFIARSGIEGSLNHRAENSRRDRSSLLRRETRQRRILLGGSAGEREVGARAA